MAGLDGIKNKIHPGQPMDKDLYDLPPKELKKIPTVCGSLREALQSLDKDRGFLKAGGVFDDDQIDAYIELKMAEVHALRDDPASGRIRHVLLGLIVSLGRLTTKPRRKPGFFVVAGRARPRLRLHYRPAAAPLTPCSPDRLCYMSASQRRAPNSTPPCPAAGATKPL